MLRSPTKVRSFHILALYSLIGTLFTPHYAHAGLLDGCWRVLHTVVGLPPYQALTLFEWEGEPPTDALWRFDHRTGRPQFAPGTKMVRVDRKHLLHELNAYRHAGFDVFDGQWGPQFVTAATRDDFAILAAGGLDSHPHEAFQARAITNDSSWVGRIGHGAEKKVPTGMMLDHVTAVISVANKNKTPIRELVFTHVHPTPSYKAAGKIYYAPLSTGDYETAKWLSQRLPVPLRLRAIAPEGFTFEAIFYQGRDVTLDYLPLHDAPPPPPVADAGNEKVGGPKMPRDLSEGEDD